MDGREGFSRLADAGLRVIQKRLELRTGPIVETYLYSSPVWPLGILDRKHSCRQAADTRGGQEESLLQAAIVGESHRKKCYFHFMDKEIGARRSQGFCSNLTAEESRWSTARSF